MNGKDQSNKNAFPLVAKGGNPLIGEDIYCYGLTKREIFAAMALQGIISTWNRDHSELRPHEAAEEAVHWADALIEALERIEEPA